MNTIRISLLAAAVLALSACGGKQPGDTIIDMQADVCATGDPSVMQKYVSKKSQPAVGMITAVMSEPAKAEQMKAQIKEECETAGAIEILETKIEGDKATVRYRNPEGKEETDTLVKEDGEWKLDFNMDK
ncbi:hypothetical protein GCM10011521_24850 [Arenimonas soli]|uniref:DUF4878 domain-containing protein n=1 Tax=Arenimonas soli TaxID=2269504 RepID=A0ABQ1HQU0_9GAMM|nr:DUF4878 domain-containing protein [Arenimonas soli]GGA85427.1 hypothetical protein GCM10011521_24850 [Arenimonas soli]